MNDADWIARRRLVAAFMAIAAACACSDDGPTFTVPTDVAYDLLGGGKLLVGFADGTYLIDAVARTTVRVNAPHGSALSPDGTRVVYDMFVYPSPDLNASSCGETSDTCWDLWVAGLNNENPQRIVALAGNVEGPPSWTPDGAAVVFGTAFLPPDRLSTIRRYAIGGGLVTLATFHPDATGNLNVCPRVEPGLDGPMSVSGSGDVVFSCATREIYVRTAAGEIRRLSPATTFPLERLLHSPTWAPDGTHIAYIEEPLATNSNGSFTLKVIDVATNAVTTLATVAWDNSDRTVDTGRSWMACWASSGSTVVFTAPTLEGAAWHLYSVPSSGGAATRVTTARGPGYGSALSCAP